jgi:hypothetical protein
MHEDLDLDHYSIEGLEALQQKIAKEISSRTQRDTKEKRAQLRALAKELGYSLSREESAPSGKRGRPRKTT